MTIPTLPDSITAMHDDDDLMNGVFSLAEQLHGKHMVATTWRDARQYAQALTMASVARNDYVVLMYDLWEAIFAVGGIDKIGSVEKDATGYPPAAVWNQEEVGKSLALLSPVEGAAALQICVRYALETCTLRLEISAIDSKENQVPIPGVLAALDGWHLDDEFDWDEDLLFSRKIKARDFPAAVTKARAEAVKLVAALLT